MKGGQAAVSNRLFFREWVAVCFVLCVGVFLALSNWGGSRLSFFKAQKLLIEGALCETKIQIEVSGAVSHPGVYEVDSGVNLKFVLDRAGLLAKADRKSLYSKKVLLESCQVHVPEKIRRKKEKRK